MTKYSILIDKLSFTADASQALRKLSGWKKHYRIPERYSDATESFAAQCATDELGKDLDRVYAQLRGAFGFARRDLKASEPLDGTGTILTPHFNYSVAVTLNQDRLDEVTWTRTVEAIKAPEQILSSAFGEVFDGVFDTVELSLLTGVDVADFIDAIEAAKIPDLALEYDREASYCRLRPTGAAETITLTDRNLAIVHDRPAKTGELVQSFETLRRLVQTHDVPLIAFTAPLKR